ncbi:MAG: 30S ribosomal protein S13 [Chloroflexota bacterium]|nr:30S ribosomal protein S13 [Chloroflexota bacterium]
MARISGVDLPKDKQIWVALQRVYGIGSVSSRRILASSGIDPQVKVKDLVEAQVARLRGVVDKEYKVEGELRREVRLNIKRLIEIGATRGTRHRMNLPVRGQRTQTNARTRRGARKTVAGRGQKRGVSKK